jgi:predicted Zn finger-like uncharacterized protein
MNSTCPHCGTTYRVDPSKIPPAGVRARCMKCEGIFRVGADAPAAPESEPALAAAAAPAASQGGAPAAVPGPEPVPAAMPAFGVADPHSKARRLARALVSDIVVYHSDRRDRSLQDGTMRQEFREEIRKSWEEYVAQVGESLARGTPYFRDALNEILAGGSQVF